VVCGVLYDVLYLCGVLYDVLYLYELTVDSFEERYTDGAAKISHNLCDREA
jgi:hypothetical protein